jgi:hypothetical protein
MVVQPCGSASVGIYSDLYTFQESGQVKNLKKMIGKTYHNRIYLKHNINSYEDTDESQSNLTQSFFP